MRKTNEQNNVNKNLFDEYILTSSDMMVRVFGR